MYTAQCVLGLIVVYVGCTQSWDIAITRGDQLEFYTNKTKTDTVRFNSHKLATLAYDEVHNMLLYVDKESDNDAICGCGIYSKLNQCFIERNGRNIHSLTFDPITEVVFFSDTNEKSINWISLKPGYNKYGNLLIKMDHGIPTDVAVDSCRGYVYWINIKLTTPTIERVRFTGSDREVVINFNLSSTTTTYESDKLQPHSLTIDQPTQIIYWIEPLSGDGYYIYYALMNENVFKRTFLHYLVTIGTKNSYPLPNTLTVSNTNLIYAYRCVGCGVVVWKLGKTNWTGIDSFSFFNGEDTVGIAFNYNIKERIQDLNYCETLTTPAIPGNIGERCHVSECENYCSQGNCSVNDEGLPTCRCNAGYSGKRCEVDTCHGYCANSGECSLNEKSEPVCQCKGDHAGDRCESSNCVNYCIQDNCSVNDEGLPRCRCNAGYSGKRCEVDTCHGYCSNNGECSLNEKSEPVCQCKGDHAGDRCEVSDCVNYCIQGNCSFNDDGLPQCRCNAGYSGDRCQVATCHGYCLNYGVCSLNEEDEPSCECVDGYEGSRCETVRNDTSTSTSTPIYSVGKTLTLADLLANWRKPKILVIVDDY